MTTKPAVLMRVVSGVSSMRMPGWPYARAIRLAKPSAQAEKKRFSAPASLIFWIPPMMALDIAAPWASSSSTSWVRWAEIRAMARLPRKLANMTQKVGTIILGAKVIICTM